MSIQKRDRSADEVPPVLYKYTDLEDWLPKMLSGESIQFSSRTSFNDPFDCRPAFQLSVDTTEGNAYIDEKLRLRHLSPAGRLLAKNQLRNQSRSVRGFVQAESDALLDKMGILCLAENWSDILLWAHYGDMHRGICTGFHSNSDVFATALPVKYRADLPVIRRPDDDTDAMLNKAFFTKAECWEYEQEWRAVKRPMPESWCQAEKAKYEDPEAARILGEQRGCGKYRFNTTAIESITFGVNADPVRITLARKWIRDAELDIAVYQAVRLDAKYSIDRKRLK